MIEVRTTRQWSDRLSALRTGFRGWYREPLPLLTVVVMAIVYQMTLCPVVYWYDSGEFAVAAPFLGIPHPTGYPLYMVLARGMCLFCPGNAALAVNTLSLLCSVLALLCFSMLLGRAGIGPMARACAIILLGTCPVIWSSAIVAEVYSLNLLLMILILMFELQYFQRGDVRYRYGAFFLLGLGLGNHLTLVFLVPGLIWSVFRGSGPRVAQPSSHPPRRRLLLLFSFVVGGLSIYLYLPVRAVNNPVINIGDPDTLAEFLRILRGGQFYKYVLSETIADPLQWLEKPSILLRQQLTGGGIILALVGLAALMKKRFCLVPHILSVSLLTLVFTIVYGVHDIELFTAPLLLVCSLLSAFAIQWFLSQFRRRADTPEAVGGSREFHLSPACFVVSLLCAVLLMRIPLSFERMNLADFRETGDYVDDVFRVLPHGAFLMNKMSPDDWYRISPIWYSRWFERRRLDVTVMDDMGFWKLQASKPPLPTYMLNDHLVARGRYERQAQGRLWFLATKQFLMPDRSAEWSDVTISIAGITNADYRHDPFTPNPEIGSPRFFPHLEAGTLYWQGIPFEILPPYAETFIPSVVTTCFQPGAVFELSLESCPTDSVWLLVDGGVQKHRSVRCATLSVEMVDGSSLVKEIHSFEEVWEYFNYKNDYMIPKERLAYGEMENVSLSVLGLKIPDGAVPRRLTIHGGSDRPAEHWYPGITIFAVTQRVACDHGSDSPHSQVGEEREDMVFLSLADVANADYRHDPFTASPIMGSPLFPDLTAGLLIAGEAAIQIALPYDTSLRPSVLTLGHLFLPSVDIVMSRRRSEALLLAVTARCPLEDGIEIAGLAVESIGGATEEFVIVTGENIVDFQLAASGHLPASKVLWGGGSPQQLQLITVRLSTDRVPERLRITMTGDSFGLSPILSIFGITQILAKD